MKEKKIEIDKGKITGFFDKKTEIVGDLKFSGSFQIDGFFKGKIDTEAVLIVGENGKVEADIKVGTIIINGEIKGDIQAVDRVEINSTGRVTGTITGPHLVVKEGAHIDANCHTTTQAVQPETKEEKPKPGIKEEELNEESLS
ncbi:MAG: polymer-forming cytoskeletal protein [Candidatus Aminicenantes bacterium]|jgi:cytoskeletal protein CcmA (bactofilin family)